MWSISTNPNQCWTKAVTIEDYSSLFTTIRDYSALFGTIRTVRTIRYSLFTLFVLFAIRTLRTIRYSRLFAVRYSLFAICYSGFPDTRVRDTGTQTLENVRLFVPSHQKTTEHAWTKTILSRGGRRKLSNPDLMNKLIRMEWVSECHRLMAWHPTPS